jgi:hypothetical protein
VVHQAAQQAVQQALQYSNVRTDRLESAIASLTEIVTQLSRGVQQSPVCVPPPPPPPPVHQMPTATEIDDDATEISESELKRRRVYRELRRSRSHPRTPPPHDKQFDMYAALRSPPSHHPHRRPITSSLQLTSRQSSAEGNSPKRRM